VKFVVNGDGFEPNGILVVAASRKPSPAINWEPFSTKMLAVKFSPTAPPDDVATIAEPVVPTTFEALMTTASSPRSAGELSMMRRIPSPPSIDEPFETMIPLGLVASRPVEKASGPLVLRDEFDSKTRVPAFAWIAIVLATTELSKSSA